MTCKPAITHLILSLILLIVAYGTERALGKQGRISLGIKDTNSINYKGTVSIFSSVYNVGIRMIFFFGLCYLRWTNFANILNVIFGILVIIISLFMIGTLIKYKNSRRKD